MQHSRLFSQYRIIINLYNIFFETVKMNIEMMQLESTLPREGVTIKTTGDKAF